VITVELARAVVDAGVLWQPAAGDRFVIDAELLTSDVFWISDLTVEVHTYRGQSLLGFNGTTEWALDSVAIHDAVWLPREDQLRELLRATFRGLRRLPDAFEVEVQLGGETRRYEHPDASEAYGMALLEFIRRSL